MVEGVYLTHYSLDLNDNIHCVDEKLHSYSSTRLQLIIEMIKLSEIGFKKSVVQIQILLRMTNLGWIKIIQ